MSRTVVIALPLLKEATPVDWQNRIGGVLMISWAWLGSLCLECTLERSDG